MIYFIFSIIALAIIVGFALPTRKANLKDSPRCPRPSNTDMKYYKTLKCIDDVPYCDDIDADTDPDEEWLYD